ncbi:coproporphyrinogen dehydrogenase HemZ [Selenihalanaerobacter shriftii]|uniref:Oxygen-independent coproporphyrinogen-3 oxidase n=1 Tax=Selenihalanaerobacter shriftii TaxID=142842 RepID=A0A1T4N0N7_9FIRM|nr:coproporphyrinogen dehydrogenase HemZ [Selenihalanaerobacter shriftii]SJZ72565.1 oxygen-independent coproporphyrinogen-3 oxidase [Selenihalanaerobacter shriftii]
MLKKDKELKVKLELNKSDHFSSVKGMLRILIPELEVVQDEEADIVVKNHLEIENNQIIIKTNLKGNEYILKKEEKDLEIQDPRYEEVDLRRRCRNKVKLHIYKLLTQYLDYPLSPWGILIGVRPTKIGHFLLDKGFSYSKVKENLTNNYGVKRKKAELLVKIVKREREYLPTFQEAKKMVNIYIGIPFCPSCCGYCSFPSYGLDQNAKYLRPFLDSLKYEIEEIGNWIIENEIQVKTIYFGGGTPTILSKGQLEELLDLVKDKLWDLGVQEFNVEAGRADTITKGKLELLKEYQVDRISINPQTMNQMTLKRIGRAHTVQKVQEAFNLARKVGFENINMDLIIGLPGETKEDFQRTALEIEKLKPDSLTVHTMAIKRASKWKKSIAKIDFPSENEVNDMLGISQQLAAKLNMEPYYMYRQKYILGNLENIGYAKTGLESIYNIIMMEERATVIGLGGGAMTKLVKPNNWRLDRLPNPKDPKIYIDQVKERTASKLQRLTSLFR